MRFARSSFAVVASLTALLVQTRAQDLPTLTSQVDADRFERLLDALVDGRPYLPGEVLVKFRQGVPTSQQLSALRAVRSTGSTPQAEWIGDTLLVSGLADQDVAQSAYVLQRQPEVEFAQPNYIEHLHSVPNDTFYSKQWDMEQINMPAAWEINKTAGQGVTVAVLDGGWTNDAGTYNLRMPLPLNVLIYGVFAVPFAQPPDFDYAHVISGPEFTQTGPWVSSTGKRVVFDTEGHGTHVAGTIAQQTDNSLGYAGVANGATIMPIKVCFGFMDIVLNWGRSSIIPSSLSGGCATSDVLQGIRYAADNGANVMNLSLGGPNPSPAYADALRYAVSRGVFVSLSAGNDGDSGNPTMYPASYAANIQGVVSVAATTSQRARAPYSEYGNWVELSAPGGTGEGTSGSIWQVMPDDDAVNTIPPRFDRYVGRGIAGTSMASPHVAGAAALLYSQGVKNPAAIEAALERFSVDLGAPGKDPEYGFGLIDVRSSLRGIGVAR